MQKANSHSKLSAVHSIMHIPENIYAQIVRLMPIPCVDLLVEDENGRILLIKRANEPAKGQWWFPGGRVHFLEKREKAAIRKLKEECGLEAFQITEAGTYDVIFDEMPLDSSCYDSHGITTVFHVVVNNKMVKLDKQSSLYAWKNINEWLTELDNEFLVTVLTSVLTSKRVPHNHM